MRKTQASVNPLFTERWSTRSYDSAALPEGALESLFEAARWSPSCFNEQPWVFIVGDRARDAAQHEAVLSVLVKDNQTWAKNAPVLMVLFSRKTFTLNSKPNSLAGFDAGSAWMALALQAQLLGLNAHAMGGFDADAAFKKLGAPHGITPETHHVHVAIAVGKSVPNAEKPEAPTERKPLSSVFHFVQKT